VDEDFFIELDSPSAPVCDGEFDEQVFLLIGGLFLGGCEVVGPPFAAGEGGSKAEESGAGGREEVFRFHHVTVVVGGWWLVVGGGSVSQQKFVPAPFLQAAAPPP
jgi:hypothetical protein